VRAIIIAAVLLCACECTRALHPMNHRAPQDRNISMCDSANADLRCDKVKALGSSASNSYVSDERLQSCAHFELSSFCHDQSRHATRDASVNSTKLPPPTVPDSAKFLRLPCRRCVHTVTRRHTGTRRTLTSDGLDP
jgi:hypothetical protein